MSGGADEAKRYLVPLGRRWWHTVEVARTARQIAPMVVGDEEDADVLVAAAFLHDVAYAPGLVVTGFHPIDGARYLRQQGQERLANLVAYHTGARYEAARRGLVNELAEFEEEVSLVADALTYCDLTTGPDGEELTPAARVEEILGKRRDKPAWGKEWKSPTSKV
ncbi:MAG: HD domain-containing protein [Acidimicrobiales bacterium]